MNFDLYFRALKKTFSGGLFLTSVFAAGVSVAAVMLLGVSGWFLTAAAIAGAAGPAAAQGFNYLLPSALIRTLAIARTVLRYGERYTGHSVALRAMAQLRPALFQRIVAAPPEPSMRLSAGETASRFVADVANLENAMVMQSAPPAAAAGAATAVALAALGDIRTALTLLAFMALGLAVTRFIHRRLPNVAEVGEAHSLARVRQRFQELMVILPDVRTADPRHDFMAELNALEDRLMAAKTGTLSREAASTAVITALTGICLVLMAMVSAKSNLPGLALSLLAGSMGFESLGALARALGQKDNIAAAHSRVAALYDQDPATPPAAETSGRFMYRGQAFRLDGTLRLGIGGPSGSGKTTLAEALMGLRAIEDLRGDANADVFAMSPQDAAVLTGTLRHNLLMGDVGATDADLWQALDDAALADRVRSLPKTLDTWIGDAGLALSGGERRRLSLARAYLRKARVLLLDEPTEGLDPATEAVVVDRLEQRLTRTGQGLIVISHRPSPHRLVTEWLRTA